ncbi:abortive phage resistance protein AbiGi (putative antitoxin) [Yokenella regensburgei]|uniref:Abortive phage resistance protein AbiGi (Putative antitoxin) n=1 Tax=Yokenella regensburgei TaxID=158877 RepID=A0ABX9S2Z9_9ENTR|nr:abortive infection system antitoxin AbiGi family protein [Yokenella regensburgei]RKR65134.1 abortive phage resistance protein AbiGi (putative antitoxin) [Yokenella regensburgei]VFS15568.1 Protein of uncharacterised function (DUF2743) [Yokenella regensburgei]
MKFRAKKTTCRIEKSLYPSTILHFTKEIESLKSILSSGYFRASYAKESIIGPDSKREFGIPMVSFCDIRLSHLYEHIKKYGRFGVGLKKEWAIKHGLNPVSYLNKNCSMFTAFNERLREMNRELRSLKAYEEVYSLEKAKYRDLINILRYMKNYEGPLVRKGELVNENYRFANENEWRYVPDIQADIVPIKIARDSDPEWKTKANQRMWKSDSSRLKFEISDIKYILVPNENYASQLIEYFGDVASGDDYTHLISKLFISRQIFNDL